MSESDARRILRDAGIAEARGTVTAGSRQQAMQIAAEAAGVADWESLTPVQQTVRWQAYAQAYDATKKQMKVEARSRGKD